MDYPDIQVSKPISKDEANEEIRRYLRYREESDEKEIFKSLTPGAQKFYLSNEVSFIFKKSDLERLIVDGANAYRIYYAANPEGVPTVVVVACLIKPKKPQGKDDYAEGFEVTNILTAAAGPAQQYATKQEPNGGSLTFDISNDDVPPLRPES